MAQQLLPHNFAVHPLGSQKRKLGFRSAYCRKSNPRKLEAPFYAPWDHIFQSLTFESPRVFHVPQMVVYRSRSDLTPAFEGNNSVSTKGRSDVDSRIPDFGFMYADTYPQVISESASWDLLTIGNTFVCAMSEIKSPPSRSLAQAAQFTSALWEKIATAQNELCECAAITFADRKYGSRSPESLILIAVSGEWFSWTELSREHLPLPENLQRRDWFKDIKPIRGGNDDADGYASDTEDGYAADSEDHEPGAGLAREEDNSEDNIHDKPGTQDENEPTPDSHAQQFIPADADSDDSDYHPSSSASDRDSGSHARSSQPPSTRPESEDYYSSHQSSDTNREEEKSVTESEEEDALAEAINIPTYFHHDILDDETLDETVRGEYEVGGLTNQGVLEAVQRRWTGFIRIETPLANQHLTIISERLSQVTTID